MSFPIVKFRSLWYTFSSILVIASLAGVGYFGLNLSLHFTGGIQNRYSFETERPAIDDMKSFIVKEEAAFNEGKENQIDIGTPIVVNSGDNSLNVRYRIPAGLDDATGTLYNDFNERLMEAVSSTYQGTEDSSFTISPSVGDVLRGQAMTATLLAILGIVLYIIFAFRKLPKKYNPVVFGLNTIIALVHDVIILLGVFVVLGYTMNVEIGPFFITAVLTILGYSVNDTIVLMDRVRENMIAHKGRESVEDSAEKAIWQTMARSLNTSVTVLITLGALLILGAESIQMFVLALFVGVIIGTYSSIFLAAPMLVTMKKWLVRK